jgi:hypothetical protein
MELPSGFTILSGGQTGADRAALDFAIRACIPHDGWCPRGRLAEDGQLDSRYHLRETPTAKYDERTRWNVRDSDATLVITIQAKPSGGTALTLGIARQLSKPHLHIARDTIESLESAAASVIEFIGDHQVTRLNVAGPRASQEPEISTFVNDLLTAIFSTELIGRGQTRIQGINAD